MFGVGEGEGLTEKTIFNSTQWIAELLRKKTHAIIFIFNLLLVKRTNMPWARRSSQQMQIIEILYTYEL